MQIFHQLDEKIAETFLAHFHPDRLYIISGYTNSLKEYFKNLFKSKLDRVRVQHFYIFSKYFDINICIPKALKVGAIEGPSTLLKVPIWLSKAMYATPPTDV